ncbi:MAG: transposase family protein [Candidatus Marinimicrobia bacterium]|nr:transposase family protein [Candidatus Neomarinimicrobiota bacterium]
MNEPEQSPRRRKSKRHQKSIIREFSMEIFIGVLFLFGVFLLFEQMEIKSYMFNGIVSFFQAITHAFSQFFGSILGAAEIFETSDIVGTLLIVVAFFLFTFRVRQKAILRFHELSACPECGGDLLHIHRTLIQRIASRIFFLKIRRYQCKSCEFQGLRMRAVKSR